MYKLADKFVDNYYKKRQSKKALKLARITSASVAE